MCPFPPHSCTVQAGEWQRRQPRNRRPSDSFSFSSRRPDLQHRYLHPVTAAAAAAAAPQTPAPRTLVDWPRWPGLRMSACSTGCSPQAVLTATSRSPHQHAHTLTTRRPTLTPIILSTSTTSSTRKPRWSATPARSIRSPQHQTASRRSRCARRRQHAVVHPACCSPTWPSAALHQALQHQHPHQHQQRMQAWDQASTNGSSAKTVVGPSLCHPPPHHLAPSRPYSAAKGVAAMLLALAVVVLAM